MCIAYVFGISSDPITYIALNFPAPVCDDCRLPMVTVTAIWRHALPEVVKVVYYQCQKCRCTLGRTRQRGGRKHVAICRRHAPAVSAKSVTRHFPPPCEVYEAVWLLCGAIGVVSA